LAKTHNKQFLELQADYLRTGDGKYLSRMYRLCVDMAGNYIRKYARERRLKLDVAELSHDSAVFVIERYLKEPGFKIDRISAYMYFGCVKNLYRDKEWEQRRVSYDDYMNGREQEYAIEEPPGHDRVPIKQGLLFADSVKGKGYEEIYV
jgi:hypothetical protein